MIRSECYAQDPNFIQYGDATYQWSNPSTPAEYYQSYLTTGEATIDQSIFTVQYRKGNVYSFGNYISQTTTVANGYYYVSENNFKKLNTTPCHGTTQPFNRSSNGESTLLIKSGKYSPDNITYSINTLQRFLINFDYGRTLLVPKIDGYAYNIGSNPVNIGSMYIDQFLSAVSAYDNYLIANITLEVKIANSTATSSFVPLFLQFAGTLRDLRYTQDRWGYNAIVDNGETSGVFLSALSHIIFSSAAWNNAGNPTPNFGCAYNLQALCNFYTAPNNSNFSGLPDVSEVYKIMDALGFYWSKNINSDCDTLGVNCTDPDVRCAVIDINNGNLVTDTVLSGTAIADYAYDNPNSNLAWGYAGFNHEGKTWDEVREEYAKPEPSTTEPVEEIDLNEPVAATSGGNTVWIMSENKVKEFFMWLWNPDGTIFDDIVKALALLGENPMDSVVTLKLYPFDLSTTSVTYAYANMCFGRKESPVNAPHLTSSNVIIFDLGSFIFNDVGMYNDFRDYEPYSDYSLYIPFVGIIQLQAIECINTTISVKMIVDIITGSATAVVYTNGVPYKYLDGQIGIEMPVTGRNMADYGKTILAGALAGAMSGKHLAGKAANAITSGHISSANTWSSVASTANPGAEMEHAESMASKETIKAGRTPTVALNLVGTVTGAAIGGGLTALMNAPQPETAGSNSPATGLAKPLYPYFIVRRSDCWIPENYNKLYGRPLLEGGVVGDFTGFSVFASIKVENISTATPEEVKLIVDLLQSGVYI